MCTKHKCPAIVWPASLLAPFKPESREWGQLADHAPITDLELILTLFFIQVAVTVQII